MIRIHSLGINKCNSWLTSAMQRQDSFLPHKTFRGSTSFYYPNNISKQAVVHVAWSGH